MAQGPHSHPPRAASTRHNAAQEPLHIPALCGRASLYLRHVLAQEVARPRSRTTLLRSVDSGQHTSIGARRCTCAVQPAQGYARRAASRRSHTSPHQRTIRAQIRARPRSPTAMPHHGHWARYYPRTHASHGGRAERRAISPAPDIWRRAPRATNMCTTPTAVGSGRVWIRGRPSPAPSSGAGHDQTTGLCTPPSETMTGHARRDGAQS